MHLRPADLLGHVAVEILGGDDPDRMGADRVGADRGGRGLRLGGDGQQQSQAGGDRGEAHGGFLTGREHVMLAAQGGAACRNVII